MPKKKRHIPALTTKGLSGKALCGRQVPDVPGEQMSSKTYKDYEAFRMAAYSLELDCLAVLEHLVRELGNEGLRCLNSRNLANCLGLWFNTNELSKEAIKAKLQGQQEVPVEQLSELQNIQQAFDSMFKVCCDPEEVARVMAQPEKRENDKSN